MNRNRPLPNLLLQPGTQGFPPQVPGLGDQEAEAEQVSDEAGCQQQQPADQDQGALNQVDSRHLSTRGLLLYPAHYLQTLVARQPGTGHTGQ